MIDPQLDGRVVLVSGANHGIGAAAAKALSLQGARVFITYYRPPCRYTQKQLDEAAQRGIGGDVLYCAGQQETPDALLDEIRAGGGEAAAREIDLADESNIPGLFDLVENDLGPVDILVCNHTHCVLETFDPALTSTEGSGVFLTTASSIDRHFQINARAYALLALEYFQRYLERKASRGRIINISTDAAHAHVANVSYAASKHAIESYSRSAALEMGKYGITVNVVAPGPIQTGYITPKAATGIAAGTPLGRVGVPQDVADVIVFLASEQAHWMTGQLLYVGGGWRMPQ